MPSCRAANTSFPELIPCVLARTLSGVCPVDDLPSGRPCAGATWHYRTSQYEGWSIALANEPATCPAVLLDPLGAPDVPLD